MHMTQYRTTAKDDKGISFPKLECWNPVTKVATVAAEVNKLRVLCRISLKVLRDKFGASEDEPMLSVTQHRAVIQNAAQKLIENKRASGRPKDLEDLAYLQQATRHNTR